MLALAAPLASAAPLRFSDNFLLPPHSPVIPAHLKFPYSFCPPTSPAPASAQPSFCAGFAAQKLLIRFYIATSHADDSLHWTVVSYPKNVDETVSRRRRKADEDVKSGADGAPADPAQALARI